MSHGFGTWNVRSLCSAGCLKTVASEVAKCNIDVVATQEVRREKGGSEPADDCTFLYGNGGASHHLGAKFFVHKAMYLDAVNFILTPCGDEGIRIVPP
jgi:endonuclease/exonuclease/phosphatase family metal-dependent hydrolase